MFKKIIVTIGLLSTAVLSSITGAFAKNSSVKESAVWTYTEDGECTYYNGYGYPLGWTKSGIAFYYFYKDGDVNRMASDEYVQGYYVDEFGSKQDALPKYSWTEVNDGYKYMNDKGEYLTGWATIDDNLYYFSSKGYRQSGVFTLDDEFYYAKEDGIVKKIELSYDEPYNITENHTSKGHNARFNGIIETWYSNWEGGQYNSVRGQDYRTSTYCGSGFFHVAKDGTIRDADGYICIATPSYENLKNHKVVLTSLGPAKVYDMSGGSRIDIYTNWH